MNNKIFFIDDDKNILMSYHCILNKQYDVVIESSPYRGLEVFQKQGPFAMVISDFKMPGMNGIEFLQEIKKISPATTRILFTAHADMTTAIQAVNEGNIFRFLEKPCSADAILETARAGIAQYSLIMAEKELLEGTLRGSVQVLTEMMAIISPQTFGRVSRIKRYSASIGKKLKIDNIWELETAAMLSQLGYVTLPDQIKKKIFRGEKTTSDENHWISHHPQITANILQKLPRMENIARIIEYQGKHYDGSGQPDDKMKGNDIPIAARILNLVIDFDDIVAMDVSKQSALEKLNKKKELYDPAMLKALEAVLTLEANYDFCDVKLDELTEHMVLVKDICSEQGYTIISGGLEISAHIIEHLKYVSSLIKITEPIHVLKPKRAES